MITMGNRAGYDVIYQTGSLCVILVGLEIQGISPFLKFDSRNSFVCEWEFAFNKSRL